MLCSAAFYPYIRNDIEMTSLLHSVNLKITIVLLRGNTK